MKSAFKAVLAAILINAVAVPGVFAQKTLEQIVARVNNDIILQSEYDSEKKNRREQFQQNGMTGAQLEQAVEADNKNIMRDLIDKALLLQQAKEMGMSEIGRAHV